MIFLRVKFYGWEIGDESFLSSFFNTIAHHLENRKWGEKYPVIMKEFYMGKLKPENIAKAREELKEIKQGLSKFPPSAIVWDINNLSVQPPWRDAIAEDITDMGNYFRTSDGAEDLFEVIEKAFASGEEFNLPVRIENI